MSSSVTKTEFNSFTWFNITKNSEKEIRYLRDHFDFDPTDITDVASPPMRPKIEFAQDYVFIILLYPIYNRKEGVVTVTELDIFANKEMVVTIHENEINVLKDLAQKVQHDTTTRKQYQKEKAHTFLLDIFEQMNMALYPMLNHVSWDIDNLESQLFTGHERQLVREILGIKRNIVSIRKTMRAPSELFQELQEEFKTYFAVKSDERFKRIINLSKDIWTQLENHKATIDAIQESNESFITFRLNDIMKTLTIFSVIVFPLTLLAAIFGMNTVEGMPFMNSSGGFWKVIAIMAIGTMFMFYWFKRHKWI